MEVGKESVVVSLASSKSIACAVKCHAGDDGEVDCVRIRKEGTVALNNTVTALMDSCGGRGEVQFEFVSYNGGKKDSFCLASLKDKGVGAHFVAEGVIEQDSVCLLVEGG